MPGTLSLTVGTTTANLPLAGTNAKINAIILRFLAFKGISTEGLTPEQIGNVFLDELRKFVIHVSSEKQSNDLSENSAATIRATVLEDNDI